MLFMEGDMDLEEYKKTYFNRWQKRMSFLCYMLFCSALVIEISVYFFMYHADLDMFFKRVIFKVLVPALIQIPPMFYIRHLINKKKVSWLTGCRLIICEFFMIISIISMLHAYLVSVLVMPAMPMILAAVIADKKMLKGLFYSSLVVFFISGVIIFVFYNELDFVFRVTSVFVNLVMIIMLYRLSKELLRSQASQVSFMNHNYKKQRALSEELQLEPLTQLYNRRALADTVEKLMKIANNGKDVLALAFLDLDNFKKINDSLGHAAGDAVLISLAEIIVKTLGTNRNAFRYGGDEFVIIFRNKEIQEIVSSVEKIMKDFNACGFDYLPADQNLVMSMSVGISVYKNEWNSKQWFKSADNAAYKAKQNGKNCYEIAE